MTDEYPPIVPYIFYDDGLAAMEWLDETLGFRERMRTVDETGALRHGEMQLGAAQLPQSEGARRRHGRDVRARRRRRRDLRAGRRGGCRGRGAAGRSAVRG